jgi:hypothetical protein
MLVLLGQGYFLLCFNKVFFRIIVKVNQSIHGGKETVSSSISFLCGYLVKQIQVVGLVIPILWITNEIMSRGPQVADMECREAT